VQRAWHITSALPTMVHGEAFGIITGQPHNPYEPRACIRQLGINWTALFLRNLYKYPAVK